MSLSESKKQSLRTQILLNGYKRPHKPPRPRYPRRAELTYKKELQSFVREIYSTIRHNLHIDRYVEEYSSLISDRKDGWIDEAERDFNVITETVAAITAVEAVNLASSGYDIVNKANNVQWYKTTKQVFGVPLFVEEPWLPDVSKAFIAENTSLIKSLSDDAVYKTKQIIYNGVQAGKTARELTKEIVNFYSTDPIDAAKGNGMRPQVRAQLIARDQVGKLNGRLTEFRQTGIGVKRYTWRDSGDQRVRKQDQMLNSNEFYWNDPPPGGHPGEKYQCRCIAEGNYDDVYEELGIAA